MIQASNFCQVISNQVPSQLQLIVRDDVLGFEGCKPPERWYSLTSPGVSLSTLLDAKTLPRRMRLLLSYQLAKAIWQYYDSDWMITPWNKDKIFFMLERRTDTFASIYVNEPFLLATFEERISPQPATQSAFQSHHFPKILALGIMMIEIELGTKIEKYIEPDMLEAGKVSMTTYHLAAVSAYRRDQLWKAKDTFCFVKDAIDTCLVPEVFKPLFDDTAGQRDELYRLIVSRLGNRYRDSWVDPENTDVDPIELDEVSRGRRNILNTSDVPRFPHNESRANAHFSAERTMSRQVQTLSSILLEFQ